MCAVPRDPHAVFLTPELDDLVARYKAKDEEICAAMAFVKRPRKELPFKTQAVSNQHHDEIELRRAFRVLTASELRKELGTARMTQKMVKSLTAVQLPSDKDPEKHETCYVFKHDEWLGREMLLKQRLGQVLQEETLSRDQHRWQLQAERVWQAGAVGMLESSGASGLLEKEQGLPFLDEYVRKWKIRTPPETDNENEQDKEDEEEAHSPSWWPPPAQACENEGDGLREEDLDTAAYDDASVAPSQGILQRMGSRSSIATPSTRQSKKRERESSIAQDGMETDSKKASKAADEGDRCALKPNHPPITTQKFAPEKGQVLVFLLGVMLHMSCLHFQPQ